MRKLHLVVVVILLAWILPQTACRFAPPDNNQDTSENGDDESHYWGRICADCHYSAGEGEGWFTMSGSGVGNFQTAIVELYPNPNGTGNLMARCEVDALGNFYTTEAIPDILQGAWPRVRDGNGNIEDHPIEIFTGQCNMCHGAQEGPIEFEFN